MEHLLCIVVVSCMRQSFWHYNRQQSWRLPSDPDSDSDISLPSYCSTDLETGAPEVAQGGITDFVQGKHTDIKTHGIAEFYSVPRVLPIASEQGLKCRFVP